MFAGPKAPFVPTDIERVDIGDAAIGALDDDSAVNPNDGTYYGVYEVALPDGVAARFRAKSDDFPPTLSVYAPDGRLMGTGPAMAEQNTNLLVRPVTGGGIHTIVVSAPDAGMHGSFRLAVDTIDEPDEHLSFPGETSGVVYDDRLTDPDALPYSAHALELYESGGLELEVESEDFAPRLMLFDADSGELLVEAVGTSSHPARLTTIAPAGSYEVAVAARKDNPDGYYHLRADHADFDSLEDFAVGDPHQSVLTWKRSDIPGIDYTGRGFEVEVDEPAVFDARLDTGAFEGLLVLTDAQGAAVAKADSVLLDTTVVRLSRPLDPGTYTLWVSSVYGAEQQGPFELHTEFRDPPATEQLVPDATVKGALTEGSLIHPRRQSFVEYYTVELDAPTRLAIELKSDEFDPYLFVEHDETGELVADNHDAGLGTTDSLIEQRFDAGTYRIGVTSLAPDIKGTFTLLVDRALP